MSTTTPPRLFLERRGEAHHHGPNGIIETRTYQVMIDLADEWATITCPQDLIDRLKPQTDIHDKRYAEEHKGAPRYGWESPDRTIWSDHILWSPPQIVSYHLPSTAKLGRPLEVAGSMSPSQVKAMVDGLVDRLPDAPRDAVIVATYLLANVAVCTGCTDAQATEALARALDQMRRAKR